jgi:hypothetical protein
LNIKKLTEGQKKGIAVVAGVGVAAGVIYYLQKAMGGTATDQLTDGGTFGGYTTPGGIVIPSFSDQSAIPKGDVLPSGGGGGQGYTPPSGGGNAPGQKVDYFPSLPNQFPGIPELPFEVMGGGTKTSSFDKLNVGESDIVPVKANYVWSGTGASPNPVINLMRYSASELYKPFQALGQQIFQEKRVPNMFELAAGAGNWIAQNIGPMIPSFPSIIPSVQAQVSSRPDTPSYQKVTSAVPQINELPWNNLQGYTKQMESELPLPQTYAVSPTIKSKAVSPTVSPYNVPPKWIKS